MPTQGVRRTAQAEAPRRLAVHSEDAEAFVHRRHTCAARGWRSGSHVRALDTETVTAVPVSISCASFQKC
jgi:hypothetical protein